MCACFSSTCKIYKLFITFHPLIHFPKFYVLISYLFVCYLVFNTVYVSQYTNAIKGVLP